MGWDSCTGAVPSASNDWISSVWPLENVKSNLEKKEVGRGHSAPLREIHAPAQCARQKPILRGGIHYLECLAGSPICTLARVIGYAPFLRDYHEMAYDLPINLKRKRYLRVISFLCTVTLSR